MDIFAYKKFELPGAVEIVAGRGGLPLVKLSSKWSECEIYLHGAHVARFAHKTYGDILWLSPYSSFAVGAPIRGGIPLCFPWFGAHRSRKDLPLHGFARTREWRLLSAAALPGGKTQAVFSTRDDTETREVWPHEFELELRVTAGEDLEMAFSVKNTGKSPFEFEDAFHSYFKVRDPGACEVLGLEGLEYLDRSKGDRRAIQTGHARFEGETIRAYMGAPSSCVLVDNSSGRRVRVEQRSIGATVIWNPGPTAAAVNREILETWDQFVCVESANCLAKSLSAAPGELHTSEMRIAALPAREGA